MAGLLRALAVQGLPGVSTVRQYREAVVLGLDEVGVVVGAGGVCPELLDEVEVLHVGSGGG